MAHRKCKLCGERSKYIQSYDEISLTMLSVPLLLHLHLERDAVYEDIDVCRDCWI